MARRSWGMKKHRSGRTALYVVRTLVFLSSGCVALCVVKMHTILQIQWWWSLVSPVPFENTLLLLIYVTKNCRNFRDYKRWYRVSSQGCIPREAMEMLSNVKIIICHPVRLGKLWSFYRGLWLSSRHEWESLCCIAECILSGLSRTRNILTSTLPKGCSWYSNNGQVTWWKRTWVKEWPPPGILLQSLPDGLDA